MRFILQHKVKVGLSIGIFCLLLPMACHSKGGSMYYEFAYDMRDDGQNAKVLDYKLSAGAKVLLVANPKVFDDGGIEAEAMTTLGPLPTDLYIRWKNTLSGLVSERRVDLRGRLPPDIDNCTLYLMVLKDNLHIYLATQAPRKLEEPAIGPKRLQWQSTKQIYAN